MMLLEMRRTKCSIPQEGSISGNSQLDDNKDCTRMLSSFDLLHAAYT